MIDNKIRLHTQDPAAKEITRGGGQYMLYTHGVILLLLYRFSLLVSSAQSLHTYYPKET